MDQEPLFFDSYEEAIAACWKRPGVNPKEVAAQVWPGLSIQAAYDRLRHGSDPARREVLSGDEVLRLMQVTERYYPIYYMCQETCHGVPARVTPEAMADAAAEEVAAMLPALKRVIGRFEKAQEMKGAA